MAGTAVLEREVQKQDRPVQNGQTVTREAQRTEDFTNCYDFLRYAEPSAMQQYVQAAPQEPQPTEAKEEERVLSSNPAERIKSYVATPANPSVKHILFADYEYSNGTLLHRDPDTGVMVPAFRGSEYRADADEKLYGTVYETPQVQDSVSVADQPAEEEEVLEEDILPTRRTMQTTALHAAPVQEVTQAEVKTGLLSAIMALSVRVKAAIIAVAATIILAIVLICINTNIIRSLDSDLSDLQNRATEQQQTYERLREESDRYTDPDSEIVRDFAERNGMTK